MRGIQRNFNSGKPLSSPWLNLHIPYQIFENSPTKYFRKGSIILEQDVLNHYVYFILNGRVRISIFGEDGVEKTIQILAKGNIFGEISSIDKSPTMITATAVADTRVAFQEVGIFLSRISNSPTLSRIMIEKLCKSVINLTQHIKDLSFLDALERVSNYLYGLSLEYGVNTESGIMLNIVFTHQEMADLTGTCRVTVSKIMNYLKQNKIIDKIDGYVYIKDLESLKKLCRF